MLKTFGQLWVPWFDNPVLCYWTDMYVDWALRAYYFPLTAAMDLQEMRDLLTGFNICQPQPRKQSNIEPA